MIVINTSGDAGFMVRNEFAKLVAKIVCYIMIVVGVLFNTDWGSLFISGIAVLIFTIKAALDIRKFNSLKETRSLTIRLLVY